MSKRRASELAGEEPEDDSYHGSQDETDDDAGGQRGGESLRSARQRQQVVFALAAHLPTNPSRPHPP